MFDADDADHVDRPPGGRRDRASRQPLRRLQAGQRGQCPGLLARRRRGERRPAAADGLRRRARPGHDERPDQGHRGRGPRAGRTPCRFGGATLFQYAEDVAGILLAASRSGASGAASTTCRARSRTARRSWRRSMRSCRVPATHRLRAGEPPVSRPRSTTTASSRLGPAAADPVRRRRRRVDRRSTRRSPPTVGSTRWRMGSSHSRPPDRRSPPLPALPPSPSPRSTSSGPGRSLGRIGAEPDAGHLRRRHVARLRVCPMWRDLPRTDHRRSRPNGRHTTRDRPMATTGSLDLPDRQGTPGGLAPRTVGAPGDVPRA